MPNVNPPVRRRAPVPKPEKLCWGLPVVGGPRGADMSLGFPVHGQGQRTNRWPYVVNSDLIGYRLSDPKLGTARIHMWKVRDGKLRYIGTEAGGRIAAVRAIERAYEKDEKAAATEVQRVAVDPPKRRRAPAS